MLPFLEKEIVEKGLASREELLDDYAIAQMTPGIIAVNISTFIGGKVAGFWGALFALMGMITPSLVIISILSFGLIPLLKRTEALHLIDGVLMGVLVLLIPVVFKMAEKYLTGKRSVLAAGIILLLRFYFELPSVWILCIGLVSGFLFYREEK